MLLLLLACFASTSGEAAGKLDSGELADASDTSDTDSGSVNTDYRPDIQGEWAAERLPAPEFAATNRDGAPRGIDNLIEGPTVMWFFPAAGTYG